MILPAYVMLFLTVTDCDTGKVLYEAHERLTTFSISGDKIEDCRKQGVTRGLLLAHKFRADGFPNASANVNCRWVSTTGEPA